MPMFFYDHEIPRNISSVLPWATLRDLVSPVMLVEFYPGIPNHEVYIFIELVMYDPCIIDIEVDSFFSFFFPFFSVSFRLLRVVLQKSMVLSPQPKACRKLRLELASKATRNKQK